MRVSWSPQCMPRSLMASRVKALVGSMPTFDCSRTAVVGRAPSALVELMETWAAAAMPMVTVARLDVAPKLSRAR